MTYRGLDPRTRLVRLGLPAIAAGLILGATLPGVVSGLLAVVAADPANLPWLFERLFAFLAYIAVTLSVVFGLLISTRLLDAMAHRPVTLTVHRDLAVLGLGLAGIHGALLGIDATMPFSVTQVLLPGAAPYAPLAVGLGQLALYLMVVMAASYGLRGWLGRRAWRAIHNLALLAFIGSTVHGIAAGTDSGQPWAQWLYLAAATVVTFLAVYRVAAVALGRAGWRDAGSAVR